MTNLSDDVQKQRRSNDATFLKEIGNVFDAIVKFVGYMTVWIGTYYFFTNVSIKYGDTYQKISGYVMGFLIIYPILLLFKLGADVAAACLGSFWKKVIYVSICLVIIVASSGFVGTVATSYILHDLSDQFETCMNAKK